MNDTTLKYLDPAVLSKISRLDLQARLVVEGFISGMHRSPFHGFSVEFASHRQYSLGDDLRHLDWKVQARTDRYYIKQYEEETNLKATFLLDASESMHYGRDLSRNGLTKYQYAAAVTASLSYLLLHQQDAAGLAVFDKQITHYCPPSASQDHITAITHALESASPAGKTSLEQVCHEAAEKIPRRGMVCIVSDLLGEIDGLVRGLQHLRHCRHEVIVLHIMDRDELEFDFRGSTMFVGLEETGRLKVDPRGLRKAYLEAVGRFCRQCKRRCMDNGVEYRLISTADRLDAALLAFLTGRLAAARKIGRGS